MTRLRCYLFGCELDDDAPCCCRCQAYLYDGDFFQVGKLEPLLFRWVGFKLWLRSLFVHEHCEVCGKRLPRGKQLVCDTKECVQNWLPF